MSNSEPFPFERLGWKAFQDFCGMVLAEILGQTYEILEPGNDIGRDGGFRGTWKQVKGEDLSGTFVVQCKHTSGSTRRLSKSSLAQEVAKAKALNENGSVDCYLLLANHRVTGLQASRIEAWFKQETGIRKFRIYASAWLTQKVMESSRLRMLVPRLYGLGDLTQILDERAYAQAEHLLLSLRNDLSKFVPTDSYRRAAEALERHHFVLLLGEPASGKSTIAATLATSASDRWGTRAIRIDEPGEFSAHWNPQEPAQFFWIEDAFGATQYQRQLANQWNQIIPKMKASLAGGARIVLTSRDYIYNEARQDLKEGELPLLNEGKVVIDVQSLTYEEKSQILYNHVRLGTQTRDFKAKLKPFMGTIAGLPTFSPEAATRLGSPTFTLNVDLSREGLTRFVEEKHRFLIEVIKGLDAKQRAVLMLLFLNGGRLQAPLIPDGDLASKAERLGISIGAVPQVMTVLDGSLVRIDWQNDQSYWTFRHPTMREAIGSIVQSDHALLDVYVQGATDQELLREVVCGEVEVRGVQVRIPAALFPHMILRVSKRLKEREIGVEAWRGRFQTLTFLASRCSASFLSEYIKQEPSFLESLTHFNSYLSAVPEPQVLTKLNQHGLLPEEIRRKYVDQVGELAVSTPDSDWMSGRASELITSDEQEEILQRVKDELIPYLSSTVSNWISDAPNEGFEKAKEHFEPLEEALQRYEEAFESRGDYSAVEAIQEGLTELESAMDDFPDLADSPTYESMTRFPSPESSGSIGERDPFDDVDA